MIPASAGRAAMAVPIPAVIRPIFRPTPVMAGPMPPRMPLPMSAPPLLPASDMFLWNRPSIDVMCTVNLEANPDPALSPVLVVSAITLALDAGSIASLIVSLVVVSCGPDPVTTCLIMSSVLTFPGVFPVSTCLIASVVFAFWAPCPVTTCRM